MQEDNPWPGLKDQTDRVKEVIYQADEPLTVHQIKGRMVGKLSSRRMENILEELKEEGVIENGPPDTADGVLGIVDKEPTYQIAKPEQDH